MPTTLAQKVNNGPLKTFSIISTIFSFSIFTPTQIEGEIHERGLIDHNGQSSTKQALAILKTFPQGIGPGSYRDISPSYTGSLSQKVIFHHNENTFLHFLLKWDLFFV